MPMSKAREIAFGALMAAMMFAVQVGLSFLPNIELVSILVIVSTVAFGRITLMSIYAFVLVEGLCYGFGIWWMNYCYVWLILYVIARIFRRCSSRLVWALICGGYGLAFGFLCAIPYGFVGGPYAALTYWVSGIPFDLIHCVSNFVIALVLFSPLCRVCRQIAGRPPAD
ncbi:MAG TPA: hypothetical protein IAB46_07345 [Candidatus Scybalocola faecigallinarum]|uniref:ECF transporter S component n=1 Tax=Candidatus Scybalocola faecigallinarum TaxID=2840941 RepID=A0A9D1JRH3_9FIRM|nr:hypothetical protein [Candidatus Scybalocola faecigallinarum]